MQNHASKFDQDTTNNCIFFKCDQSAVKEVISMSEYIPLAQAMQNKKGDIIVEVISIGDLKAGTGSKGDWTKKDAIIRDNSGEMKMTFWNGDIEKIQQGKFYKIENAFWTTYEDKPQLSLGQYFKLFETTKEKLLPKQDGFAEPTEPQLSPEQKESNQDSEECKEIVRNALANLGNDVDSFDKKIIKIWSLEKIIEDRLRKYDNGIPNPAKVGMYIKLLLDDA